MRWSVLFSLAFLAPPPVFSADAAPTPSEMAARIDDHIAAVWDANEVGPTVTSDDAEFLRRAWLDLTGTIPPLNERGADGNYGIRGFLEDTREDKRRRLIDYLLTKPTHASHMANVWRRVMLPTDANILRFGGDGGFVGWLRGQFADNRPYDELVSELLLATGAGNQFGPALYYTSLQLKPEELAASTSRIFLGVQIQCAQCHDHPFDAWTRKDFWGYAAFFAQLQRPQNRQQQFIFQVADAETGNVEIPETGEVIAPQFLGGQQSPDGEESRRQRLARWLTSTENPYFARATVNRMWGMLFGRGLVNPIDDLGKHNPSTHPELLDDLAAYFVESGFDQRRLLRALAYTRAYSLSSVGDSESEDRPDLFTRMTIKPLSPDQLYDCLTEATRRRANGTQQPPFGRAFDQNRQAFLAKFGTPTQTAEYESGIPQALTMMNGRVMRQSTDIAQSDLLIALEAPFFSNAERVETLFLSTLSRPPLPHERDKFVGYVEEGGTSGDTRTALSDVLWALLNSPEFVMNH